MIFQYFIPSGLPIFLLVLLVLFFGWSRLIRLVHHFRIFLSYLLRFWVFWVMYFWCCGLWYISNVWQIYYLMIEWNLLIVLEIILFAQLYEWFHNWCFWVHFNKFVVSGALNYAFCFYSVFICKKGRKFIIKMKNNMKIWKMENLIFLQLPAVETFSTEQVRNEWHLPQNTKEQIYLSLFKSLLYTSSLIFFLQFIFPGFFEI